MYPNFAIKQLVWSITCNTSYIKFKKTNKYFECITGFTFSSVRTFEQNFLANLQENFKFSLSIKFEKKILCMYHRCYVRITAAYSP